MCNVVQSRKFALHFWNENVIYELIWHNSCMLESDNFVFQKIMVK